VGASSTMMSAPAPPARLSTPLTERRFPMSPRNRLSKPSPSSAMASDRAPVTVTLSASAPPISRSKPASVTLLAVVLGRVTVDRALAPAGCRRHAAPDPGRMPGCP